MLSELTKEDRKVIAELAKWYTPSVLAEGIVRAASSLDPVRVYIVLPLIQGEHAVKEEKRLTTKLANLNKRYRRCRAVYSRTGYKIDTQRVHTEIQLRRATIRADRHREHVRKAAEKCKKEPAS